MDLPEPYIICNVSRGKWRYPAIKYESRELGENERLNRKFVSNYSGRCQRYYDAYRYVDERLKRVVVDFTVNGRLNLRGVFE